MLAHVVSSRDNRSVLFSSASHGEGVTTALLSVARLLVDLYRLRVLAIELNFDRPSFTRLFDLDDKRSVAAIGAGKNGATAAAQLVEQRYFVIPAGSTTPPADIASVLGKVLEEVRGEFGAILIDTPPLLQNADALALGDIAPRLVLVVEAGSTRYEDLDRVKRDLSRAGIDLIGAVLNKHKRFMPEWLYHRANR